MPKTVVYLGPSLPVEEAKTYLPDAVFRPPVKRGDVAIAAADGAEVIVIIDGVFFQNEAVAHKEILAALKSGIRVFGSSSMGALRACELEPFGMTGAGKIYEWYRDGKIIADDEVGLLYDPESGAALSDPMVNMRATFARAKEYSIITADEEKILLKACKNIYYPERTYRRVIKDADISAEKRTVLSSWIKENAVDQKREDARECLALVRDTYGK
ncbi:MAG TPA: TfuA-related McrA-glycine thioamidation protein [Methanocorpusculum sp.]|nr:TfuA-related McrA-glycine thioamidation protein [Methanocorpusculum sp.]